MYNCAVCLVLMVLFCGGAMGSPLRSTVAAESAEDCRTDARSLLLALKSVLDTAPEDQSGSDLFYGFNCTDLRAEVNPSSQTVTVCLPNHAETCSSQSSSSFSEPECLKNIQEDLQYYLFRLTAYVKSLDIKQKPTSINKLKSITDSIQSLQKCSLLPKTGKQPTTIWKPRDSFNDRMDLCKQLKGFHVRAVTINRALGYISAGEHKY